MATDASTTNEGSDMAQGNGNGTTALTTQKTPIAMGNRGMQLTTLDEAWRFAQYVQQSKLAPKQFDDPAKILIAMQSGAEIGLSPMASLQSICVINGRPSLYGDALPALAWGSGKLAEFVEWIEGEGENMVAHCKTRRVGQDEPRVTTFSVAQAKRAGLWGKAGPWKDYPERMLAMRARSWNFRDNLSDVLRGVGVEEEFRDFHESRPVIENKPVLNLDEIPDEVEGEIVEQTDEQREASRKEQQARDLEEAEARQQREFEALQR